MKHVLMYEGTGPSLDEAQGIIDRSSGVRFLESIGDNLVVEGRTPQIRQLMTKLAGWRASPVRKIKHPDNRVHVRRI